MFLRIFSSCNVTDESMCYRVNCHLRQSGDSRYRSVLHYDLCKRKSLGIYEFLLLILLRQHNCADMCKMKWGSLKPKKKNNLALPPCLKESFPRGLSSSSCTSRISSGLMPYLPARNRPKKVTFINCIVTEVQKAARHECGRWPHRLWPLTPR